MTRSPATWYVGTASGNGSRCPGPANASPTIPPGWQPGDKIVYVDEHNWLRSLAWYALGIGLSVLVAWLCFGCAAPQQSPQPQSSTVSSNQWNGIVREVPLLNKVEAPAFPAEPALVVQRQPMGYSIHHTAIGQNDFSYTQVFITNGLNKGSQFIIDDRKQPTYFPCHMAKTGRPFTVQGSNDLMAWTDLLTTNATDFTFDYRATHKYYRVKS